MISISKISPDIMETQFGFVADKGTEYKHAPTNVNRSI